MNFIQHVNTKTYSNQRPVDNVNLNTYSSTIPPARYFRKVSSCCDNNTTTVIKRVKRCKVKPVYSANTNLKDNYYSSHANYLKSRCRTYDQNNSALNFNPNNFSAKPNCVNADCSSTTYKRSNPEFGTNSAVDSSARVSQLKYGTIQRNSKFNPFQSNYTGDNTHNVQTKPQACVPHRLNGTKVKCPS